MTGQGQPCTRLGTVLGVGGSSAAIRIRSDTSECGQRCHEQGTTTAGLSLGEEEGRGRRRAGLGPRGLGPGRPRQQCVSGWKSYPKQGNLQPRTCITSRFAWTRNPARPGSLFPKKSQEAGALVSRGCRRAGLQPRALGVLAGLRVDRGRDAPVSVSQLWTA